MARKWLQAVDVLIDDATGALLVRIDALATANQPGTKMSVTSAAGGAVILAANASRRVAIITNLNTTKMLSLSLGGTPVSGSGICLAPAADATHPGGVAVVEGYSGAISGIMSGSGSSNDVAVVEV